MCSNMGHLLWSGIVPGHRVEALVDALMGDALWSGWGVRTMSEDDAASYFDYQLPEVFAGLRRSETTFPIAYPTAARPQAWAAGTPVLLLQLLLGLQPDVRRQSLETIAPPELPSWAQGAKLSGVRAFDRVWTVHLDDAQVRVEEA